MAPNRTVDEKPRLHVLKKDTPRKPVSRIVLKCSPSPEEKVPPDHTVDDDVSKPENEPEDMLIAADVAAPRRRVTIDGNRLQLSSAFDPFWEFVAERKAMDDRRRRGNPSPWTDNPVLSRLRLCNVYRILDKVSQYIVREVVEKGSQKPKEVIFRVILFDLFTKIETWEWLQRELGELTWETYDTQTYNRTLEDAKAQGMTLYTGAFQKPAPNFGFKTACRNHLMLLEVLMESLPDQLPKAKYMADVFQYIRSLQGMGDFTAYQLLLNLSYSSVLNFSQSDFVIAGPGAHSGLSRLFGKDLAKIAPGLEISAIRWLQSTQNEHFQRLGLDFSGLGPEKLPLQLCDIEHALCEFDRYARIAIPTSRSHHGQMRNRTSSKRHTFEPPDVTTDTDKDLHLPNAWQHPDRQKIRIKPGKRETVTKRYLVDNIVGHRKSSSGLMEYRVHWFGYSDSDDTWQPHDELSTDAPDVVKNYLASLTSKARK